MIKQSLTTQKGEILAESPCKVAKLALTFTRQETQSTLNKKPQYKIPENIVLCNIIWKRVYFTNPLAL